MAENYNDVAYAVEFLHTVQPFNDLTSDELNWLARKLEAAYYPQGKPIFSSSPSPGLAIIRKGAARLLDDEHKFLDKRSVLNFASAYVVSKITPPPPEHIQHLVEDIRVPMGAGKAQADH